jgi:hypothetical protein
MPFAPVIDHFTPQATMQGFGALGQGIESLAAKMEKFAEVKKQQDDTQKHKLGLIKALTPYYGEFGYGSKEEMLNDSSDTILGRVQGQTVAAALQAAKLNSAKAQQAMAWEGSMIAANDAKRAKEQALEASMEKFRSMWPADPLDAPPSIGSPPPLAPGDGSDGDFESKADKFLLNYLNLGIQTGAYAHPQFEQVGNMLRRYGQAKHDPRYAEVDMAPKVTDIDGAKVVTYRGNMQVLKHKGDGADEPLTAVPIHGAPGLVNIGGKVRRNPAFDLKSHMTPGKVDAALETIEKHHKKIEAYKLAAASQYSVPWASDFKTEIAAEEKNIIDIERQLKDAGVLEDKWKTKPSVTAPASNLDSPLLQEFKQLNNGATNTPPAPLYKPSGGITAGMGR